MSIYRKPDIERLHRCIRMAMGCLDPLSKNYDERLAWHRLLDALEGREPRVSIYYATANQPAEMDMSDHLTAKGSPSAEKVTPAPENAALAMLDRKIARLIAAMENVCDELEEDFDTVDGSDGQPAPNKAMRLASELKEAIYGPGGY